MRRSLAERLLTDLNRQFDAKGLMLKEGTLVAAAAKRPGKGAPITGGSDPDARWVVQRNRTASGEKAHPAVDQARSRSRLGLGRQPLPSGADVSELTTARALVQGDEGAFFGDAGDDSRALRCRLPRARDCQEFRVRAMTTGRKEPSHGTTQSSGHPRRAARSAACRS